MFRPIALTLRREPQNFWTLFWVLVCLHQLYFGWFLVRSSFVPYVMDGNETFSVWWHAHNLYTFSFRKSFGLTDESYGLTEASHPFFHTHQGNMPRLFGFLIYALGARTVESQVLITTLIIGNLTLFFCYASIAKVTRPAIAFLFCLVLFSDYLLYAQWHVVTYRVWYGFLFFGTLFAISSATREKSVWPYLLLGALFFLLFYFELVFAGYVSIATGFYVIWLHRGAPRRIAKLYAVQLIGGLAAFGLLVLQLTLAFGIDVVKADFSTTFLARNASTVAATIETVEMFFREHNIVFWNNFRDGNQLRTIGMFVRSISYFVFQVWTPPFFILVGIPLIGVLISFLERSDATTYAGDKAMVPPDRYLQISIVDSKGARRDFSLTIPFWLNSGRHWLVLVYICAAVLGLKALAVPGSLFGIVLQGGRSSMPWLAFAVVLALVSLALLFAGYRTGRSSWMSTARGLLTIALAAALLLESSVLFNQLYSDIWTTLFQDWRIRLVLRGATMIMLVAASYIANLGASKSFGPARKSSLGGATIFLLIGFFSYTWIYCLSPGYVLSGYSERYAPFAVFFVAMIPALAIYALIVAGKRGEEWMNAADQFAIPGRGIVVRLLVSALVAVPVLLWMSVQVYYVRLFPPDHLAFLSALKSPPLRGATFAVDAYAAPVAYFAGNWAYFDTLIGNAASIPGKFGDERATDPSSRWFADWKSNPVYSKPNYYVCMRSKSFFSVLRERNPTRLDLPFGFCKDEGIFTEGPPHSGTLIVSDFPEPKFWAVASLKGGPPKIRSNSTAVVFRDDHWTITSTLQIDSSPLHPATSQEFKLLAAAGATSCNVPAKDFRSVSAVRASSTFALPTDFAGAFQVRARVESDIGYSDWAAGDLWLVKSDAPQSAQSLSPCPITIIEGPFNTLSMRDEGWSVTEPWGAWTIGKRATLRSLPLSPSATNFDLLLEAKARAFISKPGQAQMVTVRANGVVIANWTFSDTAPEQLVTARIAKTVLAGHSELSLSFDVANPESPLSAGLSGDMRELGMGLMWLKIKEVD